MALLEYTKSMRFVDRSRNFEVVGPGKYQVPDDAVDEYLDHNGWQEVPTELQLTDAKWSRVKREVTEGEHDDILDQLEEAEANRVPSPRDSVMEAIAERRETLQEPDTEEE